MTAEDFAVSCQQDAHDADPEPAGEWLDEATLVDRALDMRTSAVARMQAAIDRPTGADLMRQAVALEVAETVAAFGGIATLHRWTRVAVTQYVACDCRDGSHPLTSLVYDTQHEHIARAEAAYTPGGHVYARTVLTLTSPPDGDLP